MNDSDKAYLQAKKAMIVGNCSCKGNNINCQCWKNFQLEVRKVTAEIPAKYREYSFEIITHPHIQKNKEEIQAYVKDIQGNFKRGMGLFLYGSSGLAKTALGCVTLMHALANGHTALYTSLSKCITYLTRGWYDEEAQNEFVDKVIGVDFLMIDNVGEEFRSGNSNLMESTFNQMFRERADRMLPTILTSNYNEEGMKSTFGNPIVSLFKEHLMSIEFKGKDFRDIVGASKGRK